MFRIRRSRALLIAIVLTIGLWHLWGTRSVDRIAHLAHLPDFKPLFPTSNKPTTSPQAVAPAATPPPQLPLSTPASRPSPTPDQLPNAQGGSAGASSSDQFPAGASEKDRVVQEVDNFDTFEAVGQGRFEVDKESADLQHARWAPQKEHFPVPSGSLIAIPSGQPKGIPQIQHKFGKRSKESRTQNDERRETVKKALAHSWKGYREFAWGHDEIAPVSQDYRNPFNGWAATLIDSLDTLWIVGLREEFEEAINKVKEIDFHTSVRKDIPIFESTIRYLGGLLGAYDISDHKYPVLLEKARELADIMIHAADTPNRMPVLFYYWAPSYASQPHRASTKVVLAELGSLSLEFSRLAMLTTEAKYYDMIARITDELEKFQTNTSLPGLWPVHIDASGCTKSDSLQYAHSASKGPQNLIPPSRPNGFGHGEMGNLESGVRESVKADGSHEIVARQLDDAGLAKARAENVVETPTPRNKTLQHQRASPHADAVSDEVDCEPQGLSAPTDSYQESFSVGGMADSTYEYLPKMHLLLAGREAKYEKMYRAARQPIIEKLLYRPMTPTKKDILFASTAQIHRSNASVIEKEYTATHLSCFLGGMFALGSRLFSDLEKDIEIAKKLTEGCIWAYSITASGIMPEEFQLLPCPNEECDWDEAVWHAALDPTREDREKSADEWRQSEKMVLEAAAAAKKAELERASTSQSPEPMPHLPDTAEADEALPQQTQPASNSNPNPDPDPKSEPNSPPPPPPPNKRSIRSPSNSPSQTTTDPASELPAYLLPHSQYVQHRINSESLISPLTRIPSRHYILRPEALESVFILYRLTGDPYYREAGWRMFSAIEKATKTEHGHSAVADVMAHAEDGGNGGYLDSMESFWIAETVKYAWLLFADEGVVDLGKWVLNTEAHPFKLGDW